VGTTSPYPTVVIVLQGPPDRRAEGREVVPIDDLDHDRSDERQREERQGKADCDRSSVGDPPGAALD
jgi:hypothetical protein